MPNSTAFAHLADGAQSIHHHASRGAGAYRAYRAHDVTPRKDGQALPGYAFENALVRTPWQTLSSIGAPVRVYLLSDLLRADFPAAEIRLAVMLNAFIVSPQLRTAIRTKLQTSPCFALCFVIYWLLLWGLQSAL